MCLVYCSAYGRIQVCKGDGSTVVHMDAYTFVKVIVLLWCVCTYIPLLDFGVTVTRTDVCSPSFLLFSFFFFFL